MPFLRSAFCRRWPAVAAGLLLMAAIPAADFDIQIQPSSRLRQKAATNLEVKELRIAQQRGIGYLPLMVMRQYRLIEQTAAAELGGLRVTWATYPSSDSMNEALDAGLLDIAAGGIVPLIQGWDQTRGGILGIAALSTMPLYLNVNNPRLKQIRDFGTQDRIVLPAVQNSTQAVILQMAAAQAFGKGNGNRLDPLMVAMPHDAGMKALLDGGVSAHFTSPPYQEQELQESRIRKLTDSYAVLGGPATFTVLWARTDFIDANPQTVRVLYDALKQAVALLNGDKRLAADIYALQADTRAPADLFYKVLSDPRIEFTTTPKSIMKFAQFMRDRGLIKTRAGSWRDYFFSELRAEPGS